MKNLKIKKNKGLTLLEIIVVAGIIGILAAIIIAQVNKTIRASKMERARAELLQIVNAINIAKVNTGARTVSEVTETYGTSQARSLSALVQSLDNISKKSGINVRNLKYDPWGYPILLMEWENPSQTTGSCFVDVIKSEDKIEYQFPYGTDYCKANPYGGYRTPPDYWAYGYDRLMEADCRGYAGCQTP